MLEERIIKYYIARTGVNHWINYTKLISKSNSLEERSQSQTAWKKEISLAESSLASLMMSVLCL